MHDSVKPHGRLPWFFTASQALADQVRGRRANRTHTAASSRMREDDGWEYQDRLGSKASNQDAELQRVVVQALPANPSGEKVLRKDIR